MGEVKSALEKAMEKIRDVEGLSQEEREALKDREKLRSMLAAFYGGKLTRDGLWERCREMKPALLREAQQSMIDTLRLGGSGEESGQRRDGILAIEVLKERQNMAGIENAFAALSRLRSEFEQARERAADELRQAIEANPHLRARPVRRADGRTVMQASLSVDEAVRERLGEYLGEQERRYEEMFAMMVERLRKEVA